MQLGQITALFCLEKNTDFDLCDNRTGRAGYFSHGKPRVMDDTWLGV